MRFFIYWNWLFCNAVFPINIRYGIDGRRSIWIERVFPDIFLGYDKSSGIRRVSAAIYAQIYDRTQNYGMFPIFVLIVCIVLIVLTPIIYKTARLHGKRLELY